MRNCRLCRRGIGNHATNPYAHAHAGRGLCRPCYTALPPDQRADHERTTRTCDDLLDDWATLRADGYTKRQAAQRLGVGLRGFRAAITRAHAAGDPRAQPALPPVGAWMTRTTRSAA